MKPLFNSFNLIASARLGFKPLDYKPIKMSNLSAYQVQLNVAQNTRLKSLFIP